MQEAQHCPSRWSPSKEAEVIQGEEEIQIDAD